MILAETQSTIRDAVRAFAQDQIRSNRSGEGLVIARALKVPAAVT